MVRFEAASKFPCTPRRDRALLEDASKRLSDTRADREPGVAKGRERVSRRRPGSPRAYRFFSEISSVDK